MRSLALPSFWICYAGLDDLSRLRAQKAYRLWGANPFHPSLHFKCVNAEEGVWSVRISKSCRALGVFEGDSVTWYWIGEHDAYLRQIAES